MSLLHAEQAAACELAMNVAALLEAMVIEKTLAVAGGEYATRSRCY